VSQDVRDMAARLEDAERALSALRTSHARELVTARAQALRDAATNTLTYHSWENLSWPRRFQVAATHGAAQRFSPEQIAHWLNARADHVDGGLPAATPGAAPGSEHGDRLAAALDLGHE
jgi:hypothetical protein